MLNTEDTVISISYESFSYWGDLLQCDDEDFILKSYGHLFPDLINQHNVDFEVLDESLNGLLLKHLEILLESKYFEHFKEQFPDLKKVDVGIYDLNSGRFPGEEPGPPKIECHSESCTWPLDLDYDDEQTLPSEWDLTDKVYEVWKDPKPYLTHNDLGIRLIAQDCVKLLTKGDCGV